MESDALQSEAGLWTFERVGDAVLSAVVNSAGQVVVDVLPCLKSTNLDVDTRNKLLKTM
jgi:hypothetical protein